MNPEAVSRLVIFDTWTRNCDRYPADLTARKPNRDNVFLEDVRGHTAGKSRLVAMDQTHCFTCGRDLDSHVGRIDWVKDERLYGLFPSFVPHVRQNEVEAGVDRLRQLSEETVVQFVATIPADWEVAPAARSALVELICQRAKFVADTITASLKQACWPDQLFDNG